MMDDKVMNMKVSCAGYFYVGHYRFGELRIILESSGIGVEVNPKLSKEFDIYELFKIFDIDPEYGKYLHEIEDRYCRVIFGKDRKIEALQHLTNDNIIWYV